MEELHDFALAIPPVDDSYLLKTHVFGAVEQVGIPTEPRDFLYGIDPVTSVVLVRSTDQRLREISRTVYYIPKPTMGAQYDFCLRASPMRNGYKTKYRVDDPVQWLADRAEMIGVEFIKMFCKCSEVWCSRDSGFSIPAAVWVGRLRVVDAERLVSVLTVGVGRHKAFGFGMMQLFTIRRTK